MNDFQYPTLTYPELYILDGGYSSFFKTHRVRCFPQSYVEMAAKEHENACERGLTKFRQRAKLNRAQTFAFGQKSLQTDESPTAQLKPQCPSFEISNFSTFFLQEKSVSFGWHGRRMASY